MPSRRSRKAREQPTILPTAVLGAGVVGAVCVVHGIGISLVPLALAGLVAAKMCGGSASPPTPPERRDGG